MPLPQMTLAIGPLDFLSFFGIVSGTIANEMAVALVFQP
jgi:hypothetical protein